MCLLFEFFSRRKISSKHTSQVIPSRLQLRSLSVYNLTSRQDTMADAGSVFDKFDADKNGALDKRFKGRSIT